MADPPPEDGRTARGRSTKATNTELIVTTFKTLMSKGAYPFSTSALADLAGLSHATVYNQFGRHPIGDIRAAMFNDIDNTAITAADTLPTSAPAIKRISHIATAHATALTTLGPNVKPVLLDHIAHTAGQPQHLAVDLHCAGIARTSDGLDPAGRSQFATSLLTLLSGTRLHWALTPADSKPAYTDQHFIAAQAGIATQALQLAGNRR